MQRLVGNMIVKELCSEKCALYQCGEEAHKTFNYELMVTTMVQWIKCRKFEVKIWDQNLPIE